MVVLNGLVLIPDVPRWKYLHLHRARLLLSSMGLPTGLAALSEKCECIFALL